MKITAGLGSVDDYPLFAEAGADECFCGYVPFSWAEKYGILNPLNRREVRAYNVQIGSYEELKILGSMRQEYQMPVALTFNALSYTPEQYPVVGEIMEQCCRAGFDTMIVADPALMVYVRQQGLPCQIHLSGEFGEVNSQMTEFLEEMKIRRVIFHRKNTTEEMKSCISHLKQNIEYEAFVLNEQCHFSGAFCNSLHCDELGHLCQTPYRLGPIRQKESRELEAMLQKLRTMEQAEPGLDVENFLTGVSGCGLCALFELRESKITHLKVVGRGNHTESMLQDIRQVKRALEMLETAGTKEEFQKQMKAEVFPGGCSGNCYYR